MKPEEYWMQRGDDVIGTDVLRDGTEARQAAVYQAIADVIMECGASEVLDVGCNVAALALFLRVSGYTGRYVGVDTNVHALRVASQRETVEIGSLRALGFGDEWVEAVVVKDVIEHLENPESLSEAFRVARDYVIVSTYLPWTDEPAEIVQHAAGYYTNRYRTADIVAIAAKCDFTLLETLIVSETNGAPNQMTLWKRNR